MNQVDELMRLATDLCAAQMKTSAEYVDAYETLKSALEAALKPGGEPVAWRYKYKFRDIGETGAYEYHSHDFACVARLPEGEPLYTAPPAQPDALKPCGEPDAYLCVDGRWIPADTDRGRALCFRMMTKLGVYTAPPARTPPPRLTETDDACTAIYKAANQETVKSQPLSTKRIFAAMRWVETAVRKQAGWE
jgi:hypothetical protein